MLQQNAKLCVYIYIYAFEKASFFYYYFLFLTVKTEEDVRTIFKYVASCCKEERNSLFST